MQYKLFTVDDIKATEDKNTFVAVITNSSMDRDGEVLLSQGADYSEFQKTGGTVFWNHDYTQPIGKATKLWKTNSAIKAEVKMAERPVDYKGSEYFPEYVMSLISQGIIKGISIGFETLDARLPSKKDLQEFGKEVKRVITRYKVIEFSVAPLQCNTDAQILSSKGFTHKDFNAKILDLKLEPEVKVESKDWEFEVLPAKKLSPSVQDIEIEVMKRKGFIYFD